jgi:hypothetical protein
MDGAYQASGGIQKSVARSADECYRALSQDEQDVARTIFLRMVHLGPRRQ